MPNEFEGLEKVASSAQKIAARVIKWIGNLKWEEMSSLKVESPFKNIRNFKNLNEKYRDILEIQGARMRPKLNVFYLEQRKIILENTVKMLSVLKNDYEALKALNIKDPTILTNKKNELDSELKDVLASVALYKVYQFDETFIKNKALFVGNLINELNGFLTKEAGKLVKYQEEVKTNKELPKKQKEEPKVTQEQPKQQVQKPQPQPQVQQKFSKKVKGKIRSK